MIYLKKFINTYKIPKIINWYIIIVILVDIHLGYPTMLFMKKIRIRISPKLLFLIYQRGFIKYLSLEKKLTFNHLFFLLI